MKICTRDSIGSVRLNRELRAYEHLSSLKPCEHIGQACIRGLLDTFQVQSSTGTHVCLVQPPMHMTITQFMRQNPAQRLNTYLLHWTLYNLLHALSFLHDEAEIVHTDIHPSNIMLTIEEDNLLDEFEQAEISDPTPAKIIDETRTIYGSRVIGLPRGKWGMPILCDFGEARIGRLHRGLIQPELYRAPEVLFSMEWTCKMDIWSVATLIWDIYEGKHLFYARDKNGECSATDHVAEMVGYLGLPTKAYLRRSAETDHVFDEQGNWREQFGTVAKPSLEDREENLDARQKEDFLRFIRRMLKWLPEERASASSLLTDAWLKDWAKRG